MEQAATHAFRRVRKVTLAIGELGHVDPDSLAFCFDVVARGTLAEGALLAIERPVGQAHCAACGNEVTIHSRAESCPCCGSYRLAVTGGEDMMIRELEVT